MQWEETDEIALAGVGISERERKKKPLCLSPQAVVICDRTSEMLVVTVVHFSTTQMHLSINNNKLYKLERLHSLGQTLRSLAILPLYAIAMNIIWYVEISDKVMSPFFFKKNISIIFKFTFL